MSPLDVLPRLPVREAGGEVERTIGRGVRKY
jgi:hypothetical protein